MFGFKMNIKPENILELLPQFGIDPAAILPQIEQALIAEAEKIQGATGKRVFLVASTVNEGKNIQVNIYTEGDKQGDLDPYKSVPFGELLNLFKTFENSVKNEVAYQSTPGVDNNTAEGNADNSTGAGATTSEHRALPAGGANA